MLRVVYEASKTLDPGQIVAIHESRGRISVEIDHSAPAELYTQALSAALKDFLAHCGWFQIWRGRIISADSPGSPLTVKYETDDKIDRARCVEVRESRGLVVVHTATEASAAEFAHALNPATAKFLAGGQWFQLWEGEIITMDGPDSRAA